MVGGLSLWSCALENWPTAQAVHAVCPAVLPTNFPAGHARQMPEVSNLPPGQISQSEDEVEAVAAVV